jgi:hypothetical protein
MTSLLLLALQLAKPEKPLDPKDASSVADHVIFNTRSQERYEIAFTSTLSVPGTQAFERKGSCVWVSPGILCMQYTGSGGEDMKVIRAGSRIWVYCLDQWATDEEAGKVGAGRGLQNPDQVLELLSKRADKCRFAKDGLEFTFTGKDLGALLGNQTDIEFDKSSSKVTVEVDGDNRLKKLKMNSTLLPKDSKNPSGTCDATIDVLSFNGKMPLKVVNSKGREIPFSVTIQQAIEAISPKK